MSSPKNARSYIWLPVKFIYFLLALSITCLIIVKSIDYFHPDFDHGFLSDKKIFFDKWYKYVLYLHILTAPITIIAGILQFSLPRKKKLHRLAGSIYIVSALLAAVAGFFMSFKSIGGLPASISFMILSCLWIFFTIKAFTCIRAGNIMAHKSYMTRSFILANSAILLRLFSFLSNHYLHGDPVISYIFISWLSWLPWILLYEFIRYFSSRFGNDRI